MRAPRHQQFQFEQDMVEAFAWHKRYLQFLETHVQKPRWLLKSPVHLWALDVLGDPRAVPALLGALSDPAFEVRSNAGCCLGL